MIRVYSSPLVPQAHIVRGALEVEGVRAEVRGEARTPLAGALPLEATLAEVWVEEADLPVARTVIDRLLPRGRNDGWLSLVPETGGDLGLTAWRCPRCSEENPAEFELCWSCETDRDP